jgi:radical SAM protein with 4Fe4S-binding SPASM domain
MTRENPFHDIYKSKQYQDQHSYSFPEIVDIELTNYCNLNCRMCARQEMTRLKGYMGKDTFEAVADECNLYKSGLRMIGWGEPFLNKNIIEFARYFKSKVVSSYYDNKIESSPLHITNNGQIITEKDMKALVEIGLDSIIFSFQGATKEDYEYMRRGSSYEKLKENILKLAEIRGENLKPYIHISSTMQGETKEEISSFVNYWDKIVDSVGIGITKPLKKNEKGLVNYRPCTEVFHKLTVKWDGQVSACCGDSNNLLVVGNIKDNTLKEIWNNSPELRSIRLLLLNNRHRTLTLCKDCDHAYDSF